MDGEASVKGLCDVDVDGEMGEWWDDVEGECRAGSDCCCWAGTDDIDEESNTSFEVGLLASSILHQDFLL